jgi:branched-chain amino acid transport system substrate-binding protein
MIYRKARIPVILICLAVFCLLVGLLSLHSSVSSAAEKIIKIGGLVDLTGPTAISGKEYLKAVNDQIKIVNDKGGINGQKVEILWEDTRWKTPETIKAFQKFAQQDKVLAMIGWAALDIDAYLPLQKTYRIPYVHASFKEAYYDAKENPYVYPICASYISQIKAAMKYFKKTWKGSSKPKVGFVVLPIYKVELDAAREYAKELDMEVVDIQTVPIPTVDSKPQLINLAKFKPDLTFNFNNVQWAAVVVKDAMALGLKTTWAGHAWAGYELLPELAGEAAEGFLEAHPVAMYGDDVPGMKKLTAINPGEKFTTPYTFGAIVSWVLFEGIKRAGGDPTSEGVKKGLETIQNFDTGGLTGTPISYSPTNHVPTKTCRIYVLEKGKFVYKENIIGE